MDKHHIHQFFLLIDIRSKIKEKNSPFLMTIYKAIKNLINCYAKSDNSSFLMKKITEDLLAIPNLIKELKESVLLNEEKIENLTNIFLSQYLSMFE